MCRANQLLVRAKSMGLKKDIASGLIQKSEGALCFLVSAACDQARLKGHDDDDERGRAFTLSLPPILVLRSIHTSDHSATSLFNSKTLQHPFPRFDGLS